MDPTHPDGDYHLATIRSELAELAERLGEILAARDDVYRQFLAQEHQEEKAFKGAGERLAREHQLRLQELETYRGQERWRIEGEHSWHNARIQSAHERALSRMAGTASYDEELRDLKARASEERDERLASVEAELARKAARIQSLRAEADGLRERIKGLASAYKVRVSKEVEPGGQQGPDFKRAVSMTNGELARTAKGLDSLQRSFWLRLMSHVSPITTYLLILLAHTAAAGVAFYFGLEWLYLAIVGASLLVACMFVHALYWSVRGRACPAVSSFHDRVAVLFPLLDHQEVAAQEQHEHDRRACMEEHIQRTTAIEDSVNARVCEEEEKKELARRMHHERFVREQEALTRKKDADLQALEAGCAQTGKEPKLQYDAGLKQIDSNHAARGKQLLNEREQAIGKVAAEWSRALCGFRDFAKEAMADCQ